MKRHIATLCKSSIFQLRQVKTISRCLHPKAKEALVRSFVCSRIDYANSLLYGVSGTLLKKLQRIQNMAARLITGRRKFDHITPVLRELHWLPVKERIEYKLSSLIYKCMPDQAPKYLKDFCIPVSTISGCQRLRSAAVGKLYVPHATTNMGKQ